MLANWDSHGCITTLITARCEVQLWRSFQVRALRLITVALMTLHIILSLDPSELHILLGGQAPAYPFRCIQDIKVRSAIQARNGGLPGRASVSEAQIQGRP